MVCGFHFLFVGLVSMDIYEKISVKCCYSTRNLNWLSFVILSLVYNRIIMILNHNSFNWVLLFNGYFQISSAGKTC